MTRFLLIFLLVLPFAACDSEKKETADADTPNDNDAAGGDELLTDADTAVAPVIGAVAVTPNEKAPLTCTVSWKTDIAATSAVEFGNGKYEFVIGDETPVKDHKVVVVGMYPETTYQLRAVSMAGDLRAEAAAEPFVTPALPGYLADATLTLHESGKTYDGWTALTLSAGDMNSGPMSMELDPDFPPTGVILDMTGRIVWYYVHNLPINGEAEYYPEDGTIIFSSQGIIFPDPTLSALLVDLAGNTVWEGPTQPVNTLIDKQYVHVFRKLPNGNWLTDMEDWHKDTNILGDNIVEINADYEVLWSWNTFDHMTPDTTGWDPNSTPLFDWTHINSIDFDAQSDTIIANARNTDSTYKIDRKTGDILWTLGKIGDLTFKGENDTPWVLKAHGAEVLDNGNIIIFDNGDTVEPNVRLWSRAVEYKIDETEKTAEIVWEYRGEEPFFAAYWGDADRLPNGNTLVSAGNWDAGRTSFLFEVDAAAKTVWTLRFGAHNAYTVGFYNACRFDPPARPIAPGGLNGAVR